MALIYCGRVFLAILFNFGMNCRVMFSAGNGIDDELQLG